MVCVLLFVAGLRTLMAGDLGGFLGLMSVALVLNAAMTLVIWVDAKGNPYRCAACKTAASPVAFGRFWTTGRIMASPPPGTVSPQGLGRMTWEDIREIGMTKVALAALTGLLGGGIAGFVLAGATAGTDATFVFYPLLCAVSGAIGTPLVRARMVRSKRLFAELEQDALGAPKAPQHAIANQ